MQQHAGSVDHDDEALPRSLEVHKLVENKSVQQHAVSADQDDSALPRSLEVNNLVENERLQQHADSVDQDDRALLSSLEVNLVDNVVLTEVQVRDIFDCSKCNRTYDHKDEYLQHLLSVHKSTTRRYEPGTSKRVGVIIKDGRYECQFCQKLFEEKYYYVAHMGTHLRNIREFEEWPAPDTAKRSNESSSHDVLPLKMSNTDASVELAQNTIVENPDEGHSKQPSSGSSPSDHEPSLRRLVNKIDVCMVEQALCPELKHTSDEHMTTKEEALKIDDISSGDVKNVNVDESNTSNNLEVNPVGSYGSRDLKLICGDNNGHPDEVAVDTVTQIEDNIFPIEITDSPVLPVQPLVSYSELDAISSKVMKSVPIYYLSGRTTKYNITCY